MFISLVLSSSLSFPFFLVVVVMCQTLLQPARHTRDGGFICSSCFRESFCIVCLSCLSARALLFFCVVLDPALFFIIWLVFAVSFVPGELIFRMISSAHSRLFAFGFFAAPCNQPQNLCASLIRRTKNLDGH